MLTIDGATVGGTISNLGNLVNGTGYFTLGGVDYEYTVAVDSGVATLSFTGYDGTAATVLTTAQAEALLDALREHNREFGGDLQVRIGINTGPVVAGVIGLKKFIYDLWGDTVNFASRMESSGVPGRIQVSEATWMRLRDGYAFEERGEIEVKGIGRVSAYLLVGKIAR